MQLDPGLLKVPGLLLLKVTVPVGALPPLTVAVHVVAEFTATIEGLHATLVAVGLIGEVIVIVFEIRVPVEAVRPEYWSVPEAEPENWIVPLEAAVYCHVKVCEPPPNIVADAGVGPDDGVALPPPENVKLLGATMFAEAVPPLLTVIVTVMVSPMFTGVVAVVAVRPPVSDAAATVKMGKVLLRGSYPVALAETLMQVSGNC